MYDAHYDLLGYVYQALKKDIESMKSYTKEVFTDNIEGGILNMPYLSALEMSDIGIETNELDVSIMVKAIVDAINNHHLLPNKENFIYGIEGCDYLKSVEELDTLYKLGIRSIAPVWNSPNQFGSGGRGEHGLTKLGKELIFKAAELNMVIDVSHANDATFWDIIACIKELKAKGKKTILIASHSNCRELFSNETHEFQTKYLAKQIEPNFYKRNLNDEQLLAVKECDGLVGIVLHKLLSKPSLDKTSVLEPKLDQMFLDALVNQFNHLRKLFNGVEHIMVSTDNMQLKADVDIYYNHCNHFDQRHVKQELNNLLLQNGYTEKEVEKIMSLNFKDKILAKITDFSH